MKRYGVGGRDQVIEMLEHMIDEIDSVMPVLMAILLVNIPRSEDGPCLAVMGRLRRATWDADKLLHPEEYEESEGLDLSETEPRQGL